MHNIVNFSWFFYCLNLCCLFGYFYFFSSLYILDIEISSHSMDCLFTSLTVSFTKQILVSFMRNHLSVVGLISWAIRDLFRKFLSVHFLSLTISGNQVLLLLLLLFMCMFIWKYVHMNKFPLELALDHLGPGVTGGWVAWHGYSEQNSGTLCNSSMHS